jgi:predicted DNA-binding transcriptional regulator YafY
LLRLTYRNAQGKSLQRTLEPLTLVFKTHLWYCFAYCRLKKDFRFFRLSRMRRLVTLKEHFVRKEKSFRDFETKQPGQVKMVSLVLKFSPRIRYRAEDYFDENQIRVQKDGSLHVRLTWPEDEWLYNFLLGYGEDMEVLEPARIREIVARKTLKTAALYAPDSVQPKSIAAVQKPPRRQA